MLHHARQADSIIGESISGVTKGGLHLLELHAEITNTRHLLHNQGIEGIELFLVAAIKPS